MTLTNTEPKDIAEDERPPMTELYLFGREVMIGHVDARLRNEDQYTRIDFVWTW